jgi:hypothetical protein
VKATPATKPLQRYHKLNAIALAAMQHLRPETAIVNLAKQQSKTERKGPGAAD